MDVRTYRATTMREALRLVSRDLGPDAAVLHTREVRPRVMFGLLSGSRQIEVTASSGVNVPSRLPQEPELNAYAPAPTPAPEFPVPPMGSPGTQSPSPGDLHGQLSDLHSMLEDLCHRSRRSGEHDLPKSLFTLFTDLIDADMSEDVARGLVERVRAEAGGSELADPMLLKSRISRMIETEIPVSGPIKVTPGRRRLVALVGPTGVGKTTTIAKLAAIYRLREKVKVGLITVDTYRIAAVEQLRTYADIIDLPMEVVSTPSEMKQAAQRLEGLDLILMDTAGRSPRDEIKIRELKSFLVEAAADEVHLVLSSVASSRTLELTAERFASVGTTRLIFTKLDEATGLGNLLPLLRSSRLPLSYLTNGQNVPDDIEIADPARAAHLMLSMEDVIGT